AAAGFDVVIVTADKDMLQLVGPGVRVFHTGREVFLDEAGGGGVFGGGAAHGGGGAGPVGGRAGKNPRGPGGRPGPPEKWITSYGSLEKLLEKMDEVPGKVGESLRQHREDAILSRRLAEIPTDLPVELSPDDLRRGPADLAKLKSIFSELEFTSLAQEIQ